jgi:RimJ/RimL family protein N-acetyltransferase
VVQVDEWWEPVSLRGKRIRLEPLSLGHAGDLWIAARDPAIWRWLPSAQPSTEADLNALIAQALSEHDRRERMPFAVIELTSGRAIGSTSLLDIEPLHRRTEIGWTWFSRESWGTGVNEESKLLLFTHSFETLDALRVGLKTDVKNERSQRAIRRIGGVPEGTLRKHRVRPDGTSRDTIFFSVLDDEWPEVRAGLEASIERFSR